MKLLRKYLRIGMLKMWVNRWGRIICSYWRAIQMQGVPTPQKSQASVETDRYLEARFPRVHVQLVSKGRSDRGGESE